MADINVNVVLPDPISVDVTSPTQALATNISVPGPQGPTGPKGNPTTINSLSAENIIITGANGNIVSNNGISIIYISGNSGYFQSAVNILTTNLENTGNNLYSLLTNFSGNLDANYATDAQLFTTGSTLDTKINNLSGYVDIQDNSILLNLNSTGSILDNRINSLSGYSASIINLASTGSNLYTLITNFSGNLDTDFASQAELNSLSGYVNSQDTLISNNLTSTGSTLDSKINSLSGYSASAVNLTSTGITLINNLFNTGSNLDTKINSLSGNLTANYSTIINLATTGSTLNTKINDFSGYVNTQDTTISTNLYNTGNTLNNRVSSLSGYVNTQDISISNNLTTTGSTLDNKINSLSGSSVLLYGNQSIGGVKTFRDNVYINNLFVTGTETIVSTNNFSVQSPYLLLNLTGGAVDGGIFFVTGAGLTGINDAGPIIGFDHSTKFKFGISTRNSDHSTLPDIASVQQIEAYSGVANNTFSTITNLALTGSTLNNKINSLSGWSASAANLYTTGSTLDLKINSLSGWSASAANLASTGSNLNNRINNLSGYINSSSSNIVFTTGNQTISGTKTFIQDTTFGDSAQGDFLVISGNNFTVYGSGNFTSGLFVNSSPVLTGSSTLYATTVNLASTGSTHNISGNLNITGNSNIRGTLDVTGLVVSGLGTPFILKSASNANSVSFNSTQNGNAGALTSNYLYSIELGHIGDENLTLSYGGGGTRNITFRGGGANISRVILDSNGNFGIGSGISSVPSRFYVSGDSLLQGNLTTSGSGIFTSGIDLNNSKLINATPDLLNVSENFNITGTQNSRVILANSPTIITGSIVSGNPIGFNTSIIQISSGQVLITGIGSNVIVNSYNNQFRTAAQYATISILHTGNDGYIMYGNTST